MGSRRRRAAAAVTELLAGVAMVVVAFVYVYFIEPSDTVRGDEE